MNEICGHYLEVDYGMGFVCTKPKDHSGVHETIESNPAEMIDKIPRPPTPPFAEWPNYRVTWERVDGGTGTIVIMESESQNAICD